MYEAFYKLTDKPFRLSPDPHFFYPSAGHKRALSYLLYGINQGEGFVVITGAPGTGKTTLAHKLLSQVDENSFLVAHLASTQIEAEDLLRLVAASFKLRSENVSKAGLLKDIESFLLARARERKRCLLVVDEAQNLPSRSIEELRMLSNFQVGNRALMQTFLLGQEQFRDMLDSPNFEQLRQRVIANYHLMPLDAAETKLYIEARLRHAGWQNDPQFEPDAYAAIYEFTGGLPRRINVFCDRVMLFGYLEGLHSITRAAVFSVIAEHHSEVTQKKQNIVYTPVEQFPNSGDATDTHESAVSVPLSTTAEPVPTLTREDDVPTVSETVSQTEPPVEAAPSPTIPNASHVDKFVGYVPVNAPQKNKTVDETAVKATERAQPEWTREPRARLNNDAAAYLRVDQSPLIAPDDREHQIARRSQPSLDRTESRWVSMIVGALAVFLALAIWFYPSLHDAWTVATTATPPPAEKQAVARDAPTSPSLVQQIADPTENILTEKRVMEPRDSEESERPPSFESRDPEIRAAADSAPSVGLSSVSIEEPGSSESAPDKTRLNPSLSKPTVSPATETKSKTPPKSGADGEGEKPKPSLRDRDESERRARTPDVKTVATHVGSASSPANNQPTSPAPSQNKAPAAKPPLTASGASPMPDVAAIVAQPSNTREVVAKVEPPASTRPVLSERELALLLVKFARYYEEGNLSQFISLFDEGAKTEDSVDKLGITKEYEDLFHKTYSRDIEIGDIRWDKSGEQAQGTGPFELRIKLNSMETARSYKGSITFRIEKKNEGALITALLHKIE